MKKTMVMLTMLFGVSAAVLADFGQDLSKANALLLKNQPAEARAAYEQLLNAPEAAPSNPKRDLYNRIATTYLVQEDAENAAKAIASARALTDKIHPNTSAETDIAEGRLLLLKKDYPGALAMFDRVLKLEYQHSLFKSKAQLYAAYALLAQEQKEAAKAAFEAVLKYPQIFGEVKKEAEAKVAELAN